jgi:hypothetical protein
MALAAARWRLRANGADADTKKLGRPLMRCVPDEVEPMVADGQAFGSSPHLALLAATCSGVGCSVCWKGLTLKLSISSSIA